MLIIFFIRLCIGLNELLDANITVNNFDGRKSSCFYQMLILLELVFGFGIRKIERSRFVH